MTSTSAMSAALKSRMAQALEADVRRRICDALFRARICSGVVVRSADCFVCRNCATAALAGVDEFCANNVREVPA